MKTPSAIQDLVSEVVHLHPEAKIELDPLPSGVCFLWVTVRDRNFVLEYHPDQGTGLSENLADTPAFVGHDETFDLLPDAIGRFKRLLADAACSAVPVEAGN